MKKVIDGLVIKEIPYGENDKLLTVITADEGKMLFCAKGARSPKSKLLPLCRIFTYANFEYYERSGRKWLSGGSVTESFYALNSDITGFALASYVLQLADEITGEGVPCPKVLQMTLNTLYAIEKKLKPLPLIKAAYEIFAINDSGFAPDVTECCECGCESSEKGYFLDVMNGHIICQECMDKRSANAVASPVDRFQTSNILVPIDEISKRAWLYVLCAEPKRIFAFGFADKESLSTFARSTETYLLNHLERDFETLKFYHTVKEE